MEIVQTSEHLQAGVKISRRERTRACKDAKNAVVREAWGDVKGRFERVGLR
jgi:hypothetical protein